MACDKFRQKWGKETDLDVIYAGCELPVGDKIIEPGMTLREVIELLSLTGGEVPYIGENGNWWIGDFDTGVKAEGDKGTSGDIQITVYAKNTSSTTPPNLPNVPEPTGWSIEPPQLTEGEYRWVSTSIQNWNRNELITNWSNPINDISFVTNGPVFSNNLSDI